MPPDEQQAIDQSVVHPVEAVALVEPGIEQAETDHRVGEPWPVQVAQQRQC